MNFANRVKNLNEEQAYAILARAQALEAQGRDIIHLEAGQPDFDTFPNIALAGVEAIVTGKTRYNPPSGILPLREAVAKHVSDQYQKNFSPDEVVITPGSKPAIFLAMLALLEPGDEVMIPDPGYPSYEASVLTAGATPVFLPLEAKKGFNLNLEKFDSLLSPRTKMIILNSPSNPTGGVLSASVIKHIAKATEKQNCWILTDEVYTRFVYEGEAPSILSIPEMEKRTILIDGFSKSYAMTGWRLGYSVMPRKLAKKMDLLLTHSVGCTATFTQYAGVEALLGPQTKALEMRDVFRKRRDLTVEALNDIPGVKCQTPAGAFYAFADVKSFGRTSKELTDYLLNEAGVALNPGTAFGPGGEGYIRISYTYENESILKGIERMKNGLASLR